MSTIATQLADKLAARFRSVEAELTKLEADAKAYQKELGLDGAAIPPVTWTAIRGDIAGAAGAVARAHLAITPYDVRPRPMDGGGK